MVRFRTVLSVCAYTALVLITCSAMYFQIRSSFKGSVMCKKTFDITSNKSKMYPKAHWKFRVSKSCMNCKIQHKSLITRHWDEDGLFCENCKSVHKEKITRHYLYDEAMRCMLCGHKKLIPKEHDESGIKCRNCKMGHFEFYNNNVLNRKRVK